MIKGGKEGIENIKKKGHPYILNTQNYHQWK